MGGEGGWVRRGAGEPIREGLSWEEMWRGEDGGLIVAWEVGRGLGARFPKLARQAKRGELPVLDWRGGVERKLQGKKFGTLFYLAQWQGLRGEDLAVDWGGEVELECRRTGQRVLFNARGRKG